MKIRKTYSKLEKIEYTFDLVEVRHALLEKAGWKGGEVGLGVVDIFIDEDDVGHPLVKIAITYERGDDLPPKE